MSDDDPYLPRHLSIEAQDYTSNLLSCIHNNQPQKSVSDEKSQHNRRPQAIKRPTKKRINIDELNAAHGLPKDLSQNFSKWFYGDIKKLTSRSAPITGLHLSPMQTRASLELRPNNFKFLTQDLGQLETEPFSIVKTCSISVEEHKSDHESALSLILQSKSTIVDRRPAMRKQKQKGSRKNTRHSESLITLEEDCDDISDPENW